MTLQTKSAILYLLDETDINTLRNAGDHETYYKERYKGECFCAYNSAAYNTLVEEYGDADELAEYNGVLVQYDTSAEEQWLLSLTIHPELMHRFLIGIDTVDKWCYIAPTMEETKTYIVEALGLPQS